jgi:hypothetical protein
LRAKAAGLGLRLRAARPLAANLNVDGNRSSHMPAGDAMVAGGHRPCPAGAGFRGAEVR